MGMVYFMMVYFMMDIIQKHFILDSQRNSWYLGRILEDYEVSVIKTVMTGAWRHPC